MLTSPTYSSSDLGFFSPSKVSNAVASTSNNVVVTTRTIMRRPSLQRQQGNSPNSRHLPASSSASPYSSPLSSPPSIKKRKLGTSETALPREVKRLRTSAASSSKPRKRASGPPRKKSSRASSRQQSLPPSPEPIYRSSRSRSTSIYPARDAEAPIQQRQWATDEDGQPGPSHLSSEMVVKRLMKSYKAYFKNPDDETDSRFKPHPTHYPVAELEYPNSGAVERFILLAPKDKDHYNPIMDLEKSLYTIVEYYLTPEQQALFGSIPTEVLSDNISPPPSPSPSPPNSESSFSSDTSSLSSVTNSSSLSSLTSLSSSSSEVPPQIPLLRAVQRAIHRQDGPLFLRAMESINRLLRKLKYPKVPKDIFSPKPCSPLKKQVETWTEHGSIPKKILMRIIEENYQRSIGPNVPRLRKYEAFSSTVYGELMPSLVYEMVQITKLREDSLFLDLGSGVGNVVTQASLQTGCRSFGIELMPDPAKIARDMLEQLKVRCRMWGVRFGEVELEQGDMLDSKRVDELIAKADVVLVDNKVFEESLNEALRPKFLDLKEGAIVISLKPFVSSINGRVTERNVDDISTIFDVSEHPYHSGSVSWGNNGGMYYMHRVDRNGYAAIRERFEKTRTVSSRSARSRRYVDVD